jgi:hypothetical protein
MLGKGGGAPLHGAPPDSLVGDGVYRTAIDAGPAFGAFIGDGVLVTGLYDSTKRAGVNAGSTGNAVIRNLESHFLLLLFVPWI